MTNWRMPDRSLSRAVLVGTSDYAELRPIPAAANSLIRMRRLLAGPLCGWPSGCVTVVENEPGPGDLPDQLIEWYAQVSDVALFYYVGHGQIDDEDELCFGLTGSRSRAERRAATSLTFRAVRKALRASPAAVKVVLLDCCFSGQAVHGPHTLAAQPADITSLTSATGAYTIAATGPYGTAWCEDEHDSPVPYTYFTKYLAELIERGLPGELTGLSLDPIYRSLRHALESAGKPVPVRSSRDAADTFIFARNAAPEPTSAAPSVAVGGGADPDLRRRLLDDAESAARAVADTGSRLHALISVAGVAPDDPDRVRRLLEEAERVTATVELATDQAGLWWAIARAAVGQDPAWARRLLRAFDQAIADADISERDRERLLAFEYFTPALLRLDPGRDEALAASIGDPGSRSTFIKWAADAVAVRDPARAERLARLAPDVSDQGGALLSVVKVLLNSDLDQAERVARGISDQRSRCRGLGEVAANVCRLDLDRAGDLLSEAERTAGQASGEDETGNCRREIVNGLLADTRVGSAGRSPATIGWLRAQAKRITGVITSAFSAAYAAMATAEAMLPDQLADARAMLEFAVARHEAISDPWERVEHSYILRDVARGMLAIDADRAVRIARSIGNDDRMRDQAYAALVEAMAPSDAGLAERVAEHIADPAVRGAALAAVAKALAAVDPETSALLVNDARRAGRAAGSDAPMLIARHVAAYDPDLATSIITEDSDESRLSNGLAFIIDAVAPHDLERASTIAQAIPDPGLRSTALKDLAEFQIKTSRLS